MSNNQVCLDYYTNEMPYLPSDVHDSNRQIYLAYAIVLYIYASFALLIFLSFKNKVVYTKQKSTFGAFVFILGYTLAVTANVLREYIGREKYPCMLLAWSYHLPILCFASQAIGVMYYYIYKLRKERAKTQAIKRMFIDDTDNESQSQSSFDLSPIQFFSKQKTKTVSFFNEIADFLLVSRHSKDGRIVVGLVDDKYQIGREPKKSTFDSSLIAQQQRDPTSTSADDSSGVYKKSLFQSIAEDIGIPLTMMTAFGFPFIIAIGLRIYLDPVYNNSCYGCHLSYVDYFIRVACVAVYVPLAVSALYAMRNEDDPLRVFKEVKYALMWGPFAILSWIPNIISSFQGYYDRSFINAIEMVGFSGVIFSYVLSGIVLSAYSNCKSKRRGNNDDERIGVKSVTVLATVDVASKEYSINSLPPPSALDLSRIFLQPKARNAFLEHSVNEISSENVAFVFKVRAWKSIWDKEKPEKITKIAVQLYKEYVSKESKSQINIPFSIFVVMEKNFKMYVDTASERNEGPDTSLNSHSKPSKDIFDACENECLLMLEHDTLPRFCQSNLFKTEIIEAGLLPKILKTQGQ